MVYQNITTEEELESALEDALNELATGVDEFEEDDDPGETSDVTSMAEAMIEALGDVESVCTFEHSMILTRNRGLVVRMRCGAEFQLTIVQSVQANGGGLDDDSEG